MQTQRMWSNGEKPLNHVRSSSRMSALIWCNIKCSSSKMTTVVALKTSLSSHSWVIDRLNDISTKLSMEEQKRYQTFLSNFRVEENDFEHWTTDRLLGCQRPLPPPPFDQTHIGTNRPLTTPPRGRKEDQFPDEKPNQKPQQKVTLKKPSPQEEVLLFQWEEWEKGFVPQSTKTQIQTRTTEYRSMETIPRIPVIPKNAKI